MKKNVLILPCSTQIGVEQFYSLKHNKHFEIWGASHNDSDNLYNNFIHLKNDITSTEFINEISQLVIDLSIDIILPAHDEVNFILKKDHILSSKIPGSSNEVVSITRFKSLTYDFLKKDKSLKKYVPDFFKIENKFLKPDKGQGSRGTYKITDPYLVCENLPGKEFTVDCFSDKNSNLIFVNGRHRKTIENGISEETSIVDDIAFSEIANLINKNIKFIGPWFFQLKEDANNHLKLLEVSPRIAGGSNINRLNGVNLTQLSLYQFLYGNVIISPQKIVMTVKRKSPKFNLDFKRVFLDYDDTYILIKDVIDSLNKEVIIITRSKVFLDLPYKIIYVKDNQLKSDVINRIGASDSIFIDDSFKERHDVLINCGIPSISVEDVNFLI
jgi:hypothetical protein